MKEAAVEERNETKVSVTLGYTLNLGNFQSLRVDLGVVDSVREGENTNEAMDRVYGFVEAKVVEKVQEAKSQLAEE
jgi:methyl coenzyme M reductase subunit D